MNLRKLIAPIITWAIMTVLIVWLLLTVGTNWGGIRQALVPGLIISAALTGLLFFIIWAFKKQFGGRKGNALEAATLLNERYLKEYLERGDLSGPQVITGGALRYSGKIQATRVELDFYTSPLHFAAYECDLNATRISLQATLAQIRVWLPEGAKGTRELANKAKTAVSFVDSGYRFALGRLFNTESIVLTDGTNDSLSPEKFREFIDGLVGVIAAA